MRAKAAFALHAASKNRRLGVPSNPPCALDELVTPNFDEGFDSLGFFPSYGFSTGLIAFGATAGSAWSVHSGSISLNYALSSRVNLGVFYTGQKALMNAPDQAQTVNFLPLSGYTGAIPTGLSVMHLARIGRTGPQPQSSSLVEEKITAQLGRGVLRLAALQNRTYEPVAFFTPHDPQSVQLFGSGMLCSNTDPNCAGGTFSPVIFNGDTNFVTPFLIDVGLNCLTNNRDMLLNYTTQLGENLHAGVSYVKSSYNASESIIDNLPNEFINFPFFEVPDTSQTTNEFRLFVGGNPSAKTSLDLSGYFVNADYHVPDPNGGAQQDIFSISGSNVFINQTPPSAYTDARYTYAAPRLGFVWRPTASVAIRAAAGGGFAAAPLYSMVGSNGTPDCSSGTFCSQTVENLSLRPETSFAYTVGTDIRLRRDTILSFDVYEATLHGQFYQFTSTAPPCPTCGGLSLQVTQNGNLGVSRYEGLLMDLRHDVPRGIYWTLSGGLTRGFVVSVPAGFYNGIANFGAGPPCTNCANLTVVPGINFNGTFAASIPYAQGLGTIGYRWSPEKYVDLSGTYFGNNNTYFRPAFVVLNGELGYPLTKNVSLVAEFRNINNIYGATTQVLTASAVSGAPTIAGEPFPLFGEMYGPRSVVATLQFHL